MTTEFDRERDGYIDDYVSAEMNAAFVTSRKGPAVPPFREPETLAEAKSQRAILHQRFPYLKGE